MTMVVGDWWCNKVPEVYVLLVVVWFEVMSLLPPGTLCCYWQPHYSQDVENINVLLLVHIASCLKGNSCKFFSQPDIVTCMYCNVIRIRSKPNAVTCLYRKHIPWSCALGLYDVWTFICQLWTVSCCNGVGGGHLTWILAVFLIGYLIRSKASSVLARVLQAWWKNDVEYKSKRYNCS